MTAVVRTKMIWTSVLVVKTLLNSAMMLPKDTVIRYRNFQRYE
jgi:hypothetical protein